MANAIEALRNIALVGHPSVGKTTLVDAFAHLIGASQRKGSVSDKSSICDTEPEEQDKGHTLQLAAVTGEHAGRQWTFLDTPGYPDFIADVNAGIFASELVLGVVSCSSGVTFNFRKKVEAAARQEKGRAVVVTHVDGDNADFDAVVETLREKIGEVCVPFLLPDQSGPGFSAVTEVVADKDSEWRRRICDLLMDACEDEELLERYLETEDLSDEEFRGSLPGAIAKGAVIPVFACNAEKDIGTAEVLAFLKDFGPHPALYPTLQSAGDEAQEIALDPEGALAGVVFAVRSDPHVGKMSLAKVMRGTLSSTDMLVGPGSSDRGEKLGGLFRAVGKKKRDALETAKPGEIVCFSKVEGVSYGQSFTVAGGSLVEVPVPMQPTPMVSVSVEPKSRADEQKIGAALQKLVAEDPTLSVVMDQEVHEMIMTGMSDLHLQVIESRLKRRYGVEIVTHAPSIHYLETITKPADGHYRHKKQTGGRGQFAECYIRIKPLEKGTGFVFTDKVVGGAIPRNLIPAAEKGMRELSGKGVLTNGRVVDVEVELYDGKFHAVDSDEASFKMAGARSFAEAFQKAGPVLLEPIMEVIASVPTEVAGAIFSDITSQRRGQVLDQWNEDNGALTVIKAHVPKSTITTYHRDLKSQTAGEGSYATSFVDYAPVPAGEQARVLAATGKKHEAD